MTLPFCSLFTSTRISGCGAPSEPTTTPAMLVLCPSASVLLRPKAPPSVFESGEFESWEKPTVTEKQTAKRVVAARPFIPGYLVHFGASGGTLSPVGNLVWCLGTA